MKNKHLKTALLASVALTLSATAQIKTPPPSPGAEIKQTVGLTQFKVTYSRPAMKGREIFGTLVPFGEVWRTGANATTKISFDTDISFGGKPVKAGEYVLFTIPGKDEWTVIVYGDTAVANAGLYDEKKDVARVTVKPVALTTPVESFSIGFDNLTKDSATLQLDWGKVRVPVVITMDTDKMSEASIKDALKKMDSWGAGDYAAAAAYFADGDRDPAKALEYMGKAVSMNDKAFYWQHAYARMLAKQGRKADAIAAAEKSLATAKANPGSDFGYVKQNEELLSSLR